MNDFQENLKDKMDKYAHFIFKISRKFPREELYGLISQFRRATMSVILNYIEGYARKKSLVRLNFLEISYGSIRESLYILNFSFDEGYITSEEFSLGEKLGNEIAAMLWTEIGNLERSVNNK